MYKCVCMFAGINRANLSLHMSSDNAMNACICLCLFPVIYNLSSKRVMHACMCVCMFPSIANPDIVGHISALR